MKSMKILFGLMGSLALAWGARAADVPPMVAQQVAPSAWYVEGVSALGSPANQNFISNAAFVITPAGVVVIDALGSPALAERLLAQIARITPQPVTHLIVTHYHADHIYGLQTFRARGVRVLAHQAARLYLNSDTAQLRLQASRSELAPWIDEETRLVQADEWLAGDRDLTVGGVRFEIRAVGANARAAAFAGMPVGWVTVKVALLSGALAGLAGAIEVAGRAGYVTLDMSPGYGSSGVVIAMLAALNPLGVVAAAVFVAGILVGADSMSRAVNVPTYIADVIVAVALLSMLVAMQLTRYRLRWR